MNFLDLATERYSVRNLHMTHSYEGSEVPFVENFMT